MQNHAIRWIFGRKMVRNDVHNAFLNNLTMRMPFPRVLSRNDPWREGPATTSLAAVLTTRRVQAGSLAVWSPEWPWAAVRVRRLPACQRHQTPTATVTFQRPNVCATTYRYASGRPGFCCCRTATEGQSPSRTATTWPLTRTIPPGAKDTFVLLMAASPYDCLLWCRV